MTKLKTFSVAAAASAALLGFSAGHVTADTAKAPLQVAQAAGSNSPGMGSSSGSGAGSGAGSMPSANPSAPSGSGSSSGSMSSGSAQCSQISDPQARQDCLQRQNDMRGSGSGATGNAPTGSGSGTTNRGTGYK